jgi:hypothetical protein
MCKKELCIIKTEVPPNIGVCGRYSRNGNVYLRDSDGKKISCDGINVLFKEHADYRDTVYKCNKCGSEILPYFLADIFSVEVAKKKK